MKYRARSNGLDGQIGNLFVRTEQAHNTKCGILGGKLEVLEGVDDNQVCTGSRIEETTDTQETWDLRGSDGDGRACHKASHGGCRDELDEPAKTKQADSKDNKPANEGERDGDLNRTPSITVCLSDMRDDVCDFETHDSDGTDRDIL